MDAFVVKVLYLDKFWRNSSAVGLVKVNDFFENNLKATIKKWKISRKQSFPLLIVIFLIHSRPVLFFYIPWKQSEFFRGCRKGKRSSYHKALGRIYKKFHQNVIDTKNFLGWGGAKEGDVTIWMSNIHNIGDWDFLFWSHVDGP